MVGKCPRASRRWLMVCLRRIQELERSDGKEGWGVLSGHDISVMEYDYDVWL
jgi:hypothetical protein